MAADKGYDTIVEQLLVVGADSFVSPHSGDCVRTRRTDSLGAPVQPRASDEERSYRPPPNSNGM